MHVTLETKKFVHILETVSRVSTKHLTLPVLQCVCIEIQNKTLILRATNLEIGIEGRMDVDMSEDGCIAVPAQILMQTVHLITQKTFSISTEGDTCIIESAASRTEIKTIPAVDFPNIPVVTTNLITIQAPLFALGIKTAAFTASQSSIKPELGCIYIHQKREHTLTFVATDSFRLMEKTVAQKGVVLNEGILIPYKNALEIARVIEGGEQEAQLFVNENQCAVRTGAFYVTTRLVTGTFPDYEGIIPKEFKTNVTLLVNDFAQGLKKTNIFLNKFMQLTLTMSEGTFTVSSQSGESGATTESLQATVTGEDLVLNFNQRYVQEVVSHLNDDSLVLKCAGVGRPMVIENVHDKSLRYLVMPMNK